MSNAPADTAILLVDPYNDFVSEGGKLWKLCQETIESVGLGRAHPPADPRVR